MTDNEKRFIKSIFSGDSSGHDYYHTIRVYKLATKIAKQENADVKIVQLAALLHDVDDIKLSPDTYVTKKNAVDFMTINKIDGKRIEAVCKIIDEVSFAGTDSVVPDDIQILEFTDITIVKNIVFDKLGVENESQVGLEGASDKVYACKGLKKEDETSDFFSFYLDEIERVQKNYKNNEHVIKYTTALLSDNQKKITIDSDVNAMKKWLEVDKFPLAKYPSKFSPTLMQQLAINIAVSEKDRNEKIFSVNGPPGTGKTTLLKEIIASNVVQMAEVLIKYGIDGGDFVFRKVESASNASYAEKYYEIPEEIAKFGILVVSNNNGAVENITLDLPKSADMEKEKTRTDYFDRKTNKEVYFSAVADKLLGKEGSAWGLISARMGRKSYVNIHYIDVISIVQDISF